MKKKLIIFFLLSLLSCEQQVSQRIVYSLGTTFITRFDVGDGRSYFFHGNKKNLDTLSTYILSRHYRGTDLMDAYLVFNTDGTVDFVPVSGDFQKYGAGSSFKLINFNENSKFIKWEKNVKQNPFNVIRIDDALNIERKYNDTFRTQVKASYP